MARFEVSLAYILGVAIPVLEAARRRARFDDMPAYVDDFIVGALLFWAARSVSRGRRYGPCLLAAAWGVLCGGLWGSFFGQLRSTTPGDISGLPNAYVVWIKGAVYILALAALFLSIRRAGRLDHGPASRG